MPPHDFTNVGIIGFVFTVVMSSLLLFLPRRLSALPILMTGCYLTLGQAVDVGGLNFTMIRVVILVGWIRVLSRRELSELEFNWIDKVFVLWVVAGFTMFILRVQTWDAVVGRLGFAYNTMGSYFLFRCLVRNIDEVVQSIELLAFLMVPLVLIMTLENLTGRNLFSIFGGVPEITSVRDGKLRCQGPFSHPILAGTFGATSIPLFVALWVKNRQARLVAAIGILSGTLMMLYTASSGPVLSFLCVLVGCVMWPFRRHVKAAWWGTLFIVVVLHMVMKAPVWFLIAKVSGVIGGGGYHRSELIDQAITHVGEWYLWGTSYTAHWMPYVLPSEPNMVDITSEYIAQGVNGGIITLVLFVLIIGLCFRQLGRAVRFLEDMDASNCKAVWALGVALFTHAMSFLSVSYFDQMSIFYYLLIAMISSACAHFPQWRSPLRVASNSH
jgi:hypothetical protein